LNRREAAADEEAAKGHGGSNANLNATSRLTKKAIGPKSRFDELTQVTVLEANLLNLKNLLLSYF